MYHEYNKANWKVRKALYETYKHKCTCCGDVILPKNMHVDHIYAEKNEIPMMMISFFILTICFLKDLKLIH